MSADIFDILKAAVELSLPELVRWMPWAAAWEPGHRFREAMGRIRQVRSPTGVSWVPLLELADLLAKRLQLFHRLWTLLRQHQEVIDSLHDYHLLFTRCLQCKRTCCIKIHLQTFFSSHDCGEGESKQTAGAAGDVRARLELRPVHHARHRRFGDAGGLWQRQPHHPGAGHARLALCARSRRPARRDPPGRAGPGSRRTRACRRTGAIC